VRIVSLHPAATEIVHLLGLAENLVGVSADSDWPPDVEQRVLVLNTVAITTRTRRSARRSTKDCAWRASG
jgi:hypothetical protein